MMIIKGKIKKKDLKFLEVNEMIISYAKIWET